jgi:hypothetical protein
VWHDQVVFSTSDGSLLRLDVTDGGERQRVRLQQSCTATPLLVHDETLVIGCADRSLLALAPSGTVRWQWWSVDQGAPEAVIGGPDGRVYVTTRLGIAVALEADSGALRWQVAVGPVGKPLGVPAVGSGLLFVPARDGLYALRLASGQLAWQRETARPVAGQPVYHEGALYVTAHDHTLAMLEAATGREMWQVKTERRIEVGPALAATSAGALRLYVADRDALSAFTPEAPDRARWRRWPSDWKGRGAGSRRRRSGRAWNGRGATRSRWAARAGIRGGRSAGCDRRRAVAGGAVAFAEAGEPEEAARCRLEAARLLLLPLISVDVEHEELVLNAWSRLQFIVRNQGFGRARRLVIRAEGDNFQGQLTATRQFSSLRAEQQRVDWLDVKPRAHGSAVPLRLTLSYADEQGESHEQSETIYMPVSRSAGQQAQASRSIAGVFGTAEALAGMDSGAFAQLHGSLMAGFGREELYTLAVELGIDYETLPPEKDDFARELLLHLARHGRQGELARLGRERRGHLDWPGSM